MFIGTRKKKLAQIVMNCVSAVGHDVADAYSQTLTLLRNSERMVFGHDKKAFLIRVCYDEGNPLAEKGRFPYTLSITDKDTDLLLELPAQAFLSHHEAYQYALWLVADPARYEQLVTVDADDK